MSSGYFELYNPSVILIRVQEALRGDQRINMGYNYLKFRHRLVSFSKNYVTNARRGTKWNL